jgi:hypothetical protein
MSTLASLAVRLGLDNSDLQKGLQQSEGMVNKFGSSIGGLLGKTAVAGFAAAATGAIALGAALKNGVDEAMAWEEGTAQLTARLKSTGGAAGVTEKQVLDLASSIQSSTKFSDDMVLSASNLMLTFTKVGRDVFPEAIRAATNMSTAMGQDLQSSVIQLGKALNDPVEGISALSRVGVQFTEDQKELIKNLVETNRVAEAQGIILQELETQMGGAAVAAGNTLAGKMEILRNSIADQFQTLGEAIMPGLNAVAEGLVAVFSDPAVTGSVEGIAGVIQDPLMRVLFDLSDWLKGAAISDFQTFGSEMQALGDEISRWFNEVSANVQQWVGQIAQFLAPLGDLLKNTLGIDIGASIEQAFKSATGPRSLIGFNGVEVWAPGTGPNAKGTTTGKSSYQQYVEDQALRNMAPDLVGRMLASGKAIPTAFSMPGVFGGGGTGAGLGATPAASAVSTFQQLLAKAFPSAGAAQGWMGDFASVQGRQATATDLRDKLAGDLFAQKYGRAATEEEWQQRYYKGSFEGVEEGGLDDIFGKPGTWQTLVDMKAKQEQEQTQKLIDAFKAETDKVLMVQMVGKRITD